MYIYIDDFYIWNLGILWEICSHICVFRKFLFNSEYSTFCWANQYDWYQYVKDIQYVKDLAGMPESKMDLF